MIRFSIIKDPSAPRSTSNLNNLKKLPKPRSQVYSLSGGQGSTGSMSSSTASMDVDMQAHEFRGSFQSSSKYGEVTQPQVCPFYVHVLDVCCLMFLLHRSPDATRLRLPSRLSLCHPYLRIR